jgi:hypothetical protein
MKGRAPSESSTALPASVRRVVASPGRPLEPATRSAMEARFGHDFARVRVHDDVEGAEAVGARAWSVERHVAIPPARYAPGTTAGDALLAHELAHVVQHDRHPAASGSRAISASSAPDEREAARAAAQVGRGEPVGALTAAPSATLHREEEVAPMDGDLATYLRTIRRTGRIEGDNDSDDKAVRIVRLWRAGRFEQLHGKDKAILIWELLDGPTTGPDEEAIVEILNRSSNDHLDKIFRFQGEAIQKQIADDVPDDEGSLLADFCRRRWLGGIEEFRKGGGYPRPDGTPIPIGAPLPTPRAGPAAPLPTLPKPKAPGTGGGDAARLPLPGVDAASVLTPEAPAWTPTPQPSDVAGPPVSAGPFPRPAPYPATGLDMVSAFLKTEKGAQIKDQTLAYLKKTALGAKPEEIVAVVLNVLVTAGIFSGVVAGAMSDTQRLQILNLFISDSDVNLLRPLDQKVVGPPVVTF